MRYFLFLDESGDHGLSNIDSSFPVFVLCGILVSESSYDTIQHRMARIKQGFWGDKKVILHSRDIRKCEKEFKILFDLEVKRRFYEDLDRLVSESNYTIIASAIQKEHYIRRYGRLKQDVYEIALSFIVERVVFCLDQVASNDAKLDIVLEKRGKKEDRQLEAHFNRLRARGTYYISPDRIRQYDVKISFSDKKDDIDGLQLADLAAYPIARFVIDSERANPAFNILAEKFYSQGKKRYGLKIFP